jgi:hypothetical protein
MRVVVLGTPSLFTEGIAARLGQHPDLIDLEVVDSRDANGLARTVANRPEVILFEEGEESMERPCPLMDLLVSGPKVRVIRLDASQDQIRVFTSEQRSVSEPRDLLGIVLHP